MHTNILFYHFLAQIFLLHNWVLQKNSIFANLHFLADSKSREMELSNDVSICHIWTSNMKFRGVGGILVVKYPNRDRVKIARKLLLFQLLI